MYCQLPYEIRDKIQILKGDDYDVDNDDDNLLNLHASNQVAVSEIAKSHMFLKAPR